jgi:hypothetical protein
LRSGPFICPKTITKKEKEKKKGNQSKGRNTIEQERVYRVQIFIKIIHNILMTVIGVSFHLVHQNDWEQEMGWLVVV